MPACFATVAPRPPTVLDPPPARPESSSFAPRPLVQCSCAMSCAMTDRLQMTSEEEPSPSPKKRKNQAPKSAVQSKSGEPAQKQHKSAVQSIEIEDEGEKPLSEEVDLYLKSLRDVALSKEKMQPPQRFSGGPIATVLTHDQREQLLALSEQLACELQRIDPFATAQPVMLVRTRGKSRTFPVPLGEFGEFLQKLGSQARVVFSGRVSLHHFPVHEGNAALNATGDSICETFGNVIAEAGLHFDQLQRDNTEADIYCQLHVDAIPVTAAHDTTIKGGNARLSGEWQKLVECTFASFLEPLKIAGLLKSLSVSADDATNCYVEPLLRNVIDLSDQHQPCVSDRRYCSTGGGRRKTPCRVVSCTLGHEDQVPMLVVLKYHHCYVSSPEDSQHHYLVDYSVDIATSDVAYDPDELAMPAAFADPTVAVALELIDQSGRQLLRALEGSDLPLGVRLALVARIRKYAHRIGTEALFAQEGLHPGAVKAVEAEKEARLENGSTLHKLFGTQTIATVIQRAEAANPSLRDEKNCTTVCKLVCKYCMLCLLVTRGQARYIAATAQKHNGISEHTDIEQLLQMSMTRLGVLAAFYGQAEYIAAFAAKHGIIGENSNIERLLQKDPTELGQLASFYGQAESVVVLAQQQQIAEYTDVTKVLAMKSAGMAALIVTLQKQSLTDVDLTPKAIHMTFAAASVEGRGLELSVHGKLQPGAEVMNRDEKTRASRSSAAASESGVSEEGRLELIAAAYEINHPGCTRVKKHAPRGDDVPCPKCRAKCCRGPKCRAKCCRGMNHKKACREK